MQVIFYSAIIQTLNIFLADVDGMDINEVSSKTNFDAVKSYIEIIIIKDSKVISMKVLHHVYGDDSEDKRYRHKLKQKIQKEFPEILQFVQLSNVCAEAVFSKSIFDNTKMPEFDPQSKIVSFFSIWVFFHEHSLITGLQGKGEGISLTPHYHFHPLHRHLGVSRAITAESSPLHIASSRTRTGNLWFPSASR